MIHPRAEPGSGMRVGRFQLVFRKCMLITQLFRNELGCMMRQ